MNKQQMLEIFTKEQRIAAVVDGYRREENDFVVRHISLYDNNNFVIYSELNEENAERVINKELGYFQSLNKAFEWKLYDYDQPMNLKELLQNKGFTIEAPEALLVLDIKEQNDLINLEIPSCIRPITTDEGIDEIINLENEVWDISHENLGDRLKRDLKNDSEHLHIYGVYMDGKVVSAAWMYLHSGTSFGSLWGGSTLPEYRNRGLYTSLLAIRTQKALEKGFSLLTVDASPMSTPILQRRGFELLAYSFPCLSPSPMN
jgi:hypothetical protein